MEPILEIIELTKRYPGVTAVDGASFEVYPGEVYGFLGRNGAGKTTTMKVILDLAKPTDGEVRLFGEDWRDRKNRARVGYLPEFPVRYPYLTPKEYLRFSARLFGVKRKGLGKLVNDVLKRVEMTDVARRRMGGFSKGMLQRVGLAQVLLNDPDLLILDEPTAGLDPLGHRLVKDIVRDMADRGKAAIVSSHILAEIEAECDRVAIIEKGRLVAEGELEELLEQTDRVEAELDKVTDAIRAAFEEIATGVLVEGNKASLSMKPGKTSLDVSRAVTKAGGNFRRLITHRVKLEDMFIKLVGGDGDAMTPVETDTERGESE
jgi:ABC-2 type transport system ATP-binding protein